MSRGGLLVVATLVVLLVIGLLFQEDRRRYTATSYGTVASGQRAWLELAAELGHPLERSFEPPDLLPERATVWWIEPKGVCDPAHEEGSPLEAFVSGGGTALVLLPGRETLFGERIESGCAGLAGIALPERVLPALTEEDRGEAVSQTVRGRLLSAPRTLVLPELARFASAAEWTPRAEADGEPFVLEASVGRGRVVAVADASFLRNAWLDGGDAAPLALDLWRAYGTPIVDEHAHGLRLEQRAAGLLVRLGALPVFLGVLALGVLVLWRGAAVPAALPDVAPGPAPVLDDFASALARLYARTRDYAPLAERYRRLALERIRVHFGLPPGFPEDQLVERLRAERPGVGERLRLLEGGAPAATEALWRERAVQLDRVVQEVCR